MPEGKNAYETSWTLAASPTLTGHAWKERAGPAARYRAELRTVCLFARAARALREPACVAVTSSETESRPTAPRPMGMGTRRSMAT